MCCPEDRTAGVAVLTSRIVRVEGMEKILGRTIEGAMIVVFTDGPALLFHETADGWKLFTKSTGSYFRQG